MTPKFKLKQQIWIVYIKDSGPGIEIEIRTGTVENISLYNIGTEYERFNYTVKYSGGYPTSEFREADMIETFQDALDTIQTLVRDCYKQYDHTQDHQEG
jgi:hypothetical protein